MADSPDLFRLPSPRSTPLIRKIGGLSGAEESPEFPALDPATQDIIARTRKYLGNTVQDTASPVLGSMPDSPFSTPMIKAATSRTKFGLPSVANVVAVSASKNNMQVLAAQNEDLTQSPDFSIEPPAPGTPFVVCDRFLR